MLQLEIVTPEKKVFSDTVADVYLPTVDGEIGVLSLHAGLVTTLAPGELRYLKDGETKELAIGSGFAEVSHDKVSVLTDLALTEGEIDEADAEEAIAKAEAAIKEVDMSQDPEEYNHLQNVVKAKVAMLNLKRKRR